MARCHRQRQYIQPSRLSRLAPVVVAVLSVAPVDLASAAPARARRRAAEAAAAGGEEEERGAAALLLPSSIVGEVTPSSMISTAWTGPALRAHHRPEDATALAVQRGPHAALASVSSFLHDTLGIQAFGAGADGGGTACRCICGDRVVWNRVVFEGDVVEEKQHECEHEVCPHVIIPGLAVTAECMHVQELKELQAGTTCYCQCGDKIAWRNRPFYGNVTEEREHYCLEDLCPRINPLPGVRFEASCSFNPELFGMPHIYPSVELDPPTPAPATKSAAAPSARWGRRPCAAALALAASSLAAALAAF